MDKNIPSKHLEELMSASTLETVSGTVVLIEHALKEVNDNLRSELLAVLGEDNRQRFLDIMDAKTELSYQKVLTAYRLDTDTQVIANVSEIHLAGPMVKSVNELLHGLGSLDDTSRTNIEPLYRRKLELEAIMENATAVNNKLSKFKTLLKRESGTL